MDEVTEKKVWILAVEAWPPSFLSKLGDYDQLFDVNQRDIQSNDRIDNRDIDTTSFLKGVIET